MIDYRSLAEQANLYYCGTTPKPYQGMPVGNGVTGSMVWIDSERIQMQINRVDVFSTNSSTTAAEWDMDSPEWTGKYEYCSGCAKASIAFGEALFDEMTQQTLFIYDGKLEIRSGAISAECIAFSETDTIIWNVQDFRKEKGAVKVILSMLRPPFVSRRLHRAQSTVDRSESQIWLTQKFSEKCDTGIRENDHFCASCVLAGVKGAEITDILENDTSISMTLNPSEETYQIYFSSGADFQTLSDAIQKAKQAYEQSVCRNWEALLRLHENWWHEFWRKSFIYTPDHPEFSKTWYSYLYYIGSTMRGDYPAKFNGLLFSTDGDDRFWGGEYWWYNQSRSHYGLSQANHGECNQPLFGMLLRNLPRYEKACQQQFGGKGGIYLPETDGFSGPEILPDNIAMDLKNALLFDAPATECLLEFMKRRSGFPSRWADFYDGKTQKEGDIQDFRWHSNLSYDAGDVANSMLEYYQYMEDEEVLKEIYPWLRGVAEFYRHHPCGEKEQDGCWHIGHLGWAESVTWAKDVIDDVTIMKGIYPTVVAISEKLGVDEELREEWKNMLLMLPPYPTSEMPDVIGGKVGEDEGTVFGIARKPCRMMSEGNPNDCRLRMTFSYDLLNLETKKSHPDEWEIANRTLDIQPVIQLLREKIPALNGENFGYSMNRVLVEAAMLGRKDLIRECLPWVLRAFHVGAPCFGGGGYFPNLLPLTNGIGGCSIQEIGTFCDQLQTPLLQSLADGPGKFQHIIHVLPAWPLEWDVAFELRAKGAFLVRAEMKKKSLRFLQITSEKGKTCLIHNPWKGKRVLLYTKERGQEILKGEILCFKTVSGGVYQLLPEGNKQESIDVRPQAQICLDRLRVDWEMEGELPTLFVGKRTVLIMSDGSMVKYTSSDSRIIFIDGTVAIGECPGEAEIFAWKDGKIIATRKICVRFDRSTF